MLLSPQIKKQYFDSNGNPLSGGKLFVYLAATTTLVSTYTTELGNEENTNPIILDSRGEIAGLFLDTGDYKFVLTDSDDVVIWTVDNITIRDFATEIDDISDTIDSISTIISSGEEQNLIVSGEKSTKSSRSRFLVPVVDDNSVKLLATDTDFIYTISDVTYTLDTDLVGSGLSSPPKTNNTALINDSNLSDQITTKTLGENGSVIPIDNIGSEISSRNGKLAAFKIVGVSTEYFTAIIDSTNSCLKNAKRGLFYDGSGDPIERTAFSDGDTITLMSLSFLYVNEIGVMIASYTEPVYSTTQPVLSIDGDMWFNMTTKKWNRYNSTIYTELEVIPIGINIVDENDLSVGARPNDFYANFDELNTFEIVYGSATTIKSKDRFNHINVYGNILKYKESSVIFDISNNLDVGESEQASIYYHAYLKENGDRVLSQIAPFNNTGDLKGYYHPHESWRYVGKVFNDSDSDFVNTGVENSPVNYFDSKFIQFELYENSSIGDLVKIFNDSGVIKAKKISGVDVLEASDPVSFDGSNDVSSSMSICFDIKNNKVVIAYKDKGNGGAGTAIVGTVSDTTISFGTPVVFEANNCVDISCCYDENSEKVVIAYKDFDNSSYGKAIVGTVSDTTISFGTAVVFESAALDIGLSCCYDKTEKKIVIVYTDVGNSSYCTAIVGTVSDTTISFGTAVVVESATANIFTSCCYDESTKKIVIFYNTTVFTAIVGTVSDTTISFGTPVELVSDTCLYNSCCYDENEKKVVVAFSDTSDDYGKALVCEIKASDSSISGSITTFSESHTSFTSCIFDRFNRKVVISYEDSDNSGYGTVIFGEVINNSITFGSKVIFTAFTINYTSSVFSLFNNKVVIIYTDLDDNYYGKAVVIDIDGPKKYIGVLLESGTTGQARKVALNSEIADAYFDKAAGTNAYIQDDGSVGNAFSKYKIGTFLSDTKLKLDKNF